MTTNSKLSTTKPKKKKNRTKQTTRTGTESQKQISHEGLSAGREREENRGKGTGNKKHKWQVQNRQGEVQNSMGNGEAKELISTIHEHERRGCGNAGGSGVQDRGGIQGEKIGTIVITQL